MKKNNFVWLLLFCLCLTNWPIQGQNLVNSNATKETQGLKSYMDEVYGQKMISGQYWNTWADYIKTNTGKTPAILGLDFMDYTPRRRQEGANPTDVEKAIEWTNTKNGIVTFSWHWDAPTDIYDVSYRDACKGTTGGDARWYKAFYSCATYFDVNTAVNSPGSANYNLLIRDIDIIATQLKRLQDANVPVLFRPLHEAAGQWFWWGAKGPGPCKKLWGIMYDRLTNYHKLNNLIWVWNDYGNEHGVSSDWFPGYNMVDIIAYDYPRSTSWSEYNTLHGGKGKLFSLAEVGGLPDPNNFNSAKWSYFVTWGDFIQNNNSIDYIKRVYNDPKVVTLESLPDWKSFGFGNNIALNKPVKVSSTEATFGNIGANGNDGNGSTRWSSEYSDPQWIQIDLGARKQIAKVALSWEAASAKSYNLEVSDDGITWTLVSAKSNMAAGPRTDNFTGLSAKGRYIRMMGTTRNTTFGYSLYEFKVDGTDAPGGPFANAGSDITATDADNNGSETISLNGSASSLEPGTNATYTWSENGIQIATGVNATINATVGVHTITLKVTDNNGVSSSDVLVLTVNAYKAPNLALNKPVTVSSTEANSVNAAVLAVDGISTTRWSSLYSDPQWIQVDLQANYLLSSVVLNWEFASGKDYRIETSLDGTTWTLAVSKSSMAAGARIDNLTGLNAVGRYVRVYGTSRTSVYGYSLYEFEVYGNLAQGINIPPTANAGADITVVDTDNTLSETIVLNGSASKDADGSIVGYNWSELTTGFSSTSVSPSVSLSVGSYTFTLKVTDDKGAVATDMVVVTVKPFVSCTLLDLFSVPTASALPSISNKTFTYVHVLGNGPNLANVSSAVIQWELQYNGLWQFAFNTNNGNPSWYLNLIPLTIQTFNKSNPACKLTGTGIAKLDGDYWVKLEGANFVMVAKTGTHALYFSNSAVRPAGCTQAREGVATMEEQTTSTIGKLTVAPSLVTSNTWITVSLPEDMPEGELKFVNSAGKVIKTLYATENTIPILIDQTFGSGLYQLQLSNGNQFRTQKMIVQ